MRGTTAIKILVYGLGQYGHECRVWVQAYWLGFLKEHSMSKLKHEMAAVLELYLGLGTQSSIPEIVEPSTPDPKHSTLQVLEVGFTLPIQKYTGQGRRPVYNHQKRYKLLLWNDDKVSVGLTHSGPKVTISRPTLQA